MVPPFTFPQSLGSLEDEDYDSNSLSVQNPTSLTTLTPSQLEEFAKGVSFDLSDKEIFCVEEQDVFDRVYSLVKEFSCLTPTCKLNVTESLRSNFSVLIPTVDSLLRRVSQNQDEDKDDESDGGDELSLADRVASCRNAFKIYTFFLVHIVLIEESNSSSTNSAKVVVSSRKKHLVSSWKWESQRARILTSVARSLEIDISSLFGTSDLDENYLSFMVINAFSMFENAAILKDSETKDALTHIIGACATKYHYAAQSCVQILHLVHKYDFAVSHLADVVGWAEKKYADGSMATSLIREIGKTSPKDYVKDTAGADNVGRFLVELADKMPKLVSINVGLLIVHFAGESYKMRNALVGVLGKLVMKAFDDTEGEGSSKSTRLRTKQAMLEILLERCRDVSAYTRSRVLQVWAELCEEKSVSMGMWNEVSEIAAGRLEDKSAIVRKSALNLLITMLQHNPFGPHLRAASFEATLEQYKKKLDDLVPTAQSAESSDETSNGDGEVHNESLSDSCLPREEETQMDDSVPDVGNLEQTRVLVASLGAGLRFSNCVSATMPTLIQLMASSSASDVENTILLLMRCRQFQIDGSEACLRKMLPLVFSQDKAIYEAVENAFIAIYVGKSPVETAKNLSSLAVDSNIGDLASLEFLIGALMSKGDLTSSTLSALWDFFCFNISGTTAEQSRGALSILCMAAKTSNTILSSHLQDIVDIGFGRWAKVEPLLVRTACLALQRLSEEDKKKLLSTYGSRVFSILESLVTGFWLPEHIWYAAADRAISTVYAIHPHPEKMAADLVKKSLNSVFGGEELQSGSFDTLTAVEVTKLSRFLFIISHIAMNQLVYIESRVRKIQKDKAKSERIAIEDNNDNTTPNAHKDNINAELGIAASEDALLDTLSERAEKEIVSGGSSERNLIGYCTPFLSKLCRNYNLMQKYPELQASGMLALCRFMIIDADFCNANLQLLFTVVENAPSETVRSNCTIALGDLAVRFPNLLEPWTEHVYARLRDPSISVRKNTVLVLSHLILNDMMKVKGYINEMAICLEDEDERISNLAKLFFHELSKKGNNPIYNLLPDILGKLCNQNLKEESFCNIMQFLIGSIKKDKQMESLVEKLCHRFSGVTDVKLYEYISYCLSQLSYTDKSMKKLIELFKTYEHALSEDSVMDNFRNIINKGKKFAKPDLKSCIEEFEEKLSKFHVERKEQELTAKNAQSHQQKVESLESIVVTGKDKDEVAEKDKDEVTEKDKEEVDGSVITEDSEVVDPSMEAQTECSEAGCAEAEDKSHASSEVADSRMDENEVQSPRTLPKGSTRPRAKRSSKNDQNVDTSDAPRRTTRSSRRP